MRDYGTIHYLAGYECNVGNGLNASEVVTKFYIASFGKLHRLIALRKSGTLFWVGTDHLGSTVRVADASFNPVDQMRYLPYGGSRDAGNSLQTDYRFTSQIEDQSIGLYWYSSRAYDTALGRFVVADTIVPRLGNPQTLNRYTYVLNNSLRYTDPSGHTVRPDGECGGGSSDGNYLSGGSDDNGLYEEPVYTAPTYYFILPSSTPVPPETVDPPQVLPPAPDSGGSGSVIESSGIISSGSTVASAAEAAKPTGVCYAPILDQLGFSVISNAFNTAALLSEEDAAAAAKTAAITTIETARLTSRLLTGVGLVVDLTIGVADAKQAGESPLRAVAIGAGSAAGGFAGGVLGARIPGPLWVKVPAVLAGAWIGGNAGGEGARDALDELGIP